MKFYDCRMPGKAERKRYFMWNRIFNVDNVVFRAIDTMGKIFILNLYWLVCSLPIFTIGASTTALIYASMKLHDREGYVTSNFFSSFKENFKQATGIWLCCLAAGAVLAFDFLMGNQVGGTFGLCLQAAALMLGIPYFLMLLYVFGVQSRFVNTVKNTIRYSFFLSLRNMKYTVQMALLVILLVWVNTTVLLANFLTLVYGFGLMGYFFAAYYKKAFGKYLNAEEQAQE